MRIPTGSGGRVYLSALIVLASPLTLVRAQLPVSAQVVQKNGQAVEENWNFYLTERAGHAASIYLNLAYGGNAPVAGFGQLVRLRIEMKQPRPDGLSSNEEFETLGALEDDIEREIQDDSSVIYVGRITSSGHRDLYFYTRGGGLEAKINTSLKSWPSYRGSVYRQEDDAWSFYRTKMFPSSSEIQVMGNRDIVENLLKNGDDSHLSREISHWAYFRKARDRNAFSDFVRARGFRVKEDWKSGDADNPFAVRFARIDRPTALDEITVELNRVAGEMGGDYDGWESQVVGSRH